MAARVASEVPQARRGLDYLTAVFVSKSERHRRETFDFCADLVESIHPVISWEEGRSGPFFAQCFVSSIGARLETTEVDGPGGKNPGMTVLNLPGAFFYLQETDKLMLSLYRLFTYEGFKNCSRLDFMVTELNPEWPAERVCDAVRQGKVWVAGHRTVREWCPREITGECNDGVTLYWGSPKSHRQARTYDKGAESRWPVPAIRDEVQLRGPWAQTYTQKLRQDLTVNLTSAAMDQAINATAVAACLQHLDYWDTSRADPANDIHWKRHAEPCDWYRQRLGLASEPARLVPREPLDEDEAVAHGLRTYGKIFGRQLRRMCADPEIGVLRALMRFGGQFLARLDEEGWEEFIAMAPEADRPRLRAELREILNAIALEAEHRDG